MRWLLALQPALAPDMPTAALAPAAAAASDAAECNSHSRLLLLPKFAAAAFPPCPSSAALLYAPVCPMRTNHARNPEVRITVLQQPLASLSSASDEDEEEKPEHDQKFYWDVIKGRWVPMASKSACPIRCGCLLLSPRVGCAVMPRCAVID